MTELIDLAQTLQTLFFNYCLNKAKSILEGRQTDLDWLDVAHRMVRVGSRP
jgi:hypothetical protein